MRRVLRATSLAAAALAFATPATPQATPVVARDPIVETLEVPVFPGQMVKATLTLPDLHEAPYPAVLLIAVREPGAGTPATALAMTDALIANGVAVVHLDVPPPLPASSAEPVDQPADDAFAVLQFVREREDVDGDRVAIIGVGAAAQHAARAAALDEAARALVLLGAEPLDSDTLGLPTSLPLLSLPIEMRAAPAVETSTSPVSDAAAFIARHLQ